MSARSDAQRDDVLSHAQRLRAEGYSVRHIAREVGYSERQMRRIFAQAAAEPEPVADTESLPYILPPAPVGYRYAARLVPHAPEMAVVLRIRTLAAEGRSLYVIAQTLEREGYRTRRGRPYSRSSVREIFRAYRRNLKKSGRTVIRFGGV